MDIYLEEIILFNERIIDMKTKSMGGHYGPLSNNYRNLKLLKLKSLFCSLSRVPKCEFFLIRLLPTPGQKKKNKRKLHLMRKPLPTAESARQSANGHDIALGVQCT